MKGNVSQLQCLEVIIGDSRPPPECPHGPTLLFRRLVGEEDRLFYACSACRDRKDCNFFLWANEEFNDSKRKVWQLETQRVLPAIDHSKLYVKLMKLMQSPSNRAYCHDCSELLTSNEIKKHVNHEIDDELTDYQITHPSELLKPLDNARKEAQYLFSKKSTEMMVSSLKNLGVEHVLCIGAPRVHEHIISDCSAYMDSVLLDIDYRYHQFHGPLQFCWYNVFNNHYFNKSTGAQVVNDFLQQDSGKGFAIVIDPPFGGRVEPLANTVQLIIKQHRSLNKNVDSDLTVLWTFPYFMEPHLLSSLPNYKMLDYKVEYDNHPLFTQGPRGRKYGSPVRIFTNKTPKEFPLPEEEGYKFCKPCKRWVSQENEHCKKCSSCTSKDGQTYVHCPKCDRCVKPSWLHCTQCKRCCIKDHKCSGPKPSNLCFHCGEPGHKKADCKAGSKKREGGAFETEDKVTKKQKTETTNIPKIAVDLGKAVDLGNENKKKRNNSESSTNQVTNGSPTKGIVSKKEKINKIENVDVPRKHKKKEGASKEGKSGKLDKAIESQKKLKINGILKKDKSVNIENADETRKKQKKKKAIPKKEKSQNIEMAYDSPLKKKKKKKEKVDTDSPLKKKIQKRLLTS